MLLFERLLALGGIFVFAIGTTDNAYANSYAPTILTQPSISNLNGDKITTAEAGKQVIIGTTATNNPFEETSCVIIIQVRNSDGATVFLAFQTLTLAPRNNSTLGASWLIEEQSLYEVKVFALSQLQNPVPLSIVMSTSLQSL